MRNILYLSLLVVALTACSEGFQSVKKFNLVSPNTGGTTAYDGSTTGGLPGGTTSGTTTGGTTGSTGSTTGSTTGEGPTPNSTRIFSPGNGIDLNQVNYIRTGNVAGYSRISSTDGQQINLTAVGFRPGTFHIDYTHQEQWVPYAIDIGGDGTFQAATAWIFFYIDGQWYGTGGERLRPRQFEKSLDHASRVGEDWFYSDVWGIMHKYRPAPGEMVGFMVTQGLHRADNTSPLQERTNVVLIPFPADGQDAYNSPIVWSE